MRCVTRCYNVLQRVTTGYKTVYYEHLHLVKLTYNIINILRTLLMKENLMKEILTAIFLFMKNKEK